MAGNHQNPDGTFNGLAVMGELSGLGESEMKKIWASVKVNSAKLNACGHHLFQAIEPSEKYKKRYRCSACDGEIDAIAYHWHEQGRRQ